MYKNETREKTVLALENYRYDELLCENLNIEIDRLGKILLLKEKPQANGDIFRFHLNEKGKFIKKYSRRYHIDSYNKNIESALGNYTPVNPMEEIKVRQLQRDIVRTRMKVIENALGVLTEFHRELIKRSVIYRFDDVSIEEIAESMNLERYTLYYERDKALEKLGEILGK